MKNKHTLVVEFPADLYESFQEACGARRLTISEQVRGLVTEWLAELASEQRVQAALVSNVVESPPAGCRFIWNKVSGRRMDLALDTAIPAHWQDTPIRR